MSFWCSETDAVLAKEWQAGRTASVISALFGGVVSRCAVIGRIHRIGISKRAPKPIARGPKVIRKKPKKLMEPTMMEIMSEPVKIAFSESAPVSLMELGPHHCRWPLWAHDGAVSDRYCGCAADLSAGRPYCEAHDKISRGKRLSREEIERYKKRSAQMALGRKRKERTA